MKTMLSFASLLLLAGLAQGKVTETLQKSIPVQADGTLTLDNVNGSITITAWDKPEIGIEAEKSAEDAEGLKRITIEITGEGQDVQVKTQYSKKFWNNNGSVSYKIHAPAGVRLKHIEGVNSSLTVTGITGSAKLETVNGSIHAEGLGGDAKLETVNGSIYASFAKLPAGSKVKLESTNGSNTLVLPHEARTSLSAETVNGKIHLEVPPADNEGPERGVSQTGASASKDGHAMNIDRDNHHVKAVIGAADADVHVETVNGSITIKTF